MAIAARRLGLDPAELARRNLVPADAMPYRTPSGRAVRLGRLRGLPRPGARARATTTALRARVDAARAEGRLAGIGLACIVEPSISNMGYITLAQTADERAAHAAEVGQRRGRVDRDRPARRDHRRLATTPQGQGHRTVCAQVVADVLGCAPDDVTVMSEMDTASVPWTVASGNYSSRFSGVAVGAVQAAALKLAREDRRDPRARRRRRASRCAGSPGWRTGTPRGCRTARSRASPRSPSGRRRTSTRPTPRTASPRRPPTASSSTSAPSRSTARPGEVRVLDYVTVHDAGRAPQPAARRRAGARRLRPRRRRRALRAPRLRRVGQPDDRVARRLPRPDRARHPGAPDRPPLVAVARSRRSAPRGSARGTR